jgi:IS5 family transposase
MGRRPAAFPARTSASTSRQDEPLPDWMDARVVHGDETHEIHFVDEGRRCFLIRQRSDEYGIRKAVATAARGKGSRLTNPFEYLASLATDALYQGRERSRPGGTRGGLLPKAEGPDSCRSNAAQAGAGSSKRRSSGSSRSVFRPFRTVRSA